MNLLHSPIVLPLNANPDGTITIGKTRINLVTVVGAFKQGYTCEEIVFQFPTLDLGDVYTVISFYLKNQGAVENYIALQGVDAARIRQDIEAKFPSGGIRQRLMGRRSN